MNTATASQLPIDFPECPDVDGSTILRVVPATEPAPVERLATVHRLVPDVLAAALLWLTSVALYGLNAGLSDAVLAPVASHTALVRARRRLLRCAAFVAELCDREFGGDDRATRVRGAAIKYGI